MERKKMGIKIDYISRCNIEYKDLPFVFQKEVYGMKFGKNGAPLTLNQTSIQKKKY